MITVCFLIWQSDWANATKLSRMVDQYTLTLLGNNFDVTISRSCHRNSWFHLYFYKSSSNQAWQDRGLTCFGLIGEVDLTTTKLCNQFL